MTRAAKRPRTNHQKLKTALSTNLTNLHEWFERCSNGVWLTRRLGRCGEVSALWLLVRNGFAHRTGCHCERSAAIFRCLSFVDPSSYRQPLRLNPNRPRHPEVSRDLLNQHRRAIQISRELKADREELLSDTDNDIRIKKLFRFFFATDYADVDT